MTLQVGQVISAPFLAASAEVKSFSARPGYYLLEVVLQNGSQQYQQHHISEGQLRDVEVLTQSGLMRAVRAEALFLLIEAHRIRLAHQFDPQLAVSISQVDPLPHQIEAVYHYVLPMPRIRFLIADDPGAGKTIMAGLILKELQARRLARRVLIVAPGHLKYQWQRELKEKFGSSFAIVDRSRMDSAWGENVWEERDHLITSIDFVKQDAVQRTLASTQWDLVIVDEAHKMSAYAYESRESVKIDKTKRYQVGELLSAQANHLLFLTATPHRGNEENFRLFLDLLRPGFFAQTELLRESVEAGDNPIFVRRLKEDMHRFDGSAIFPPRHVRSVRFRLPSEELKLYNDVTNYVRDYFDKAKQNRSISFALMILQRRLTSSAYAILRSLERRRERLEALLELPERIREDRDYLHAQQLSEEDIEEMAEEERAKIERRIEHLTIAENIEQVRAEIAQLGPLIAQARRVLESESESKLSALRDQILTSLGDQKLLIFTEFKDTVDYLIEKLQGWGYQTVTIHGGMNMDQRIAAEREFKHHSQIMVATEAAGEGINLQFCSVMVNYDIPWNPNRLEQRMGRIHRYGQKREVFIWNLIAQDTREGQILDRLFEKLDIMRQELGSDRVFDIIGELIPGTRLDMLLKDAIFSQRSMDEIEQTIDQVEVERSREALERAFLTSLATRHIDYSELMKEQLEAQEHRLVPEYVEDFFRRAFEQLDGKMERRGAGYRIASVPYELRARSNDYAFKTDYGTVARDYPRVTFDKAHARTESSTWEFVAPGHPLLEAVNDEILERFRDTQGDYALFGDPEGERKGVYWFIEGEVQDGRGAAAARRVFCLFQKSDGTLRRVDPAVLWDHEPLDGADPPLEVVALLDQEEEVLDHVMVEVLFPFKDEIQERRDHETEIKAKYGMRSLDYLIGESNQKILDYQLRQDLGEAVELPLGNERRKLHELEQRKADLEEEIRQERNLTIGPMKLLGAAAVVPIIVAEAEELEDLMEGDEGEVHHDAPASYTVTSADPERKAEIEAVGMQIAIQHERERGWKPEDVSTENVGFDVRSFCLNEDGVLTDVRYIEVKARAQSGEVRISSNEWKKARKYGDDYWLYIVTEAGTDYPELHTLQNPAAHFQLDEDIFASGFVVPEERWRRRIGE